MNLCVLPIQDYNFRCVYCYATHKKAVMGDATAEYHNRKRPLANGQCTFKVIKENIIKLLDIDKDIIVALRINVDDENFEYVEELMDIIPEDKRNRIELMLSNLFHNNDKFSIYKNAIGKGYDYAFKENTYFVCV